jgi:5-methylthioadenosine/S-adenosylhomocysteine deaminase
MTLTLIRAETVVTMDGDGSIFRPGAVLLEDDTILEVGPDDSIQNGNAEVLDLHDRLVMPGLINAHTHTPMVLFRGLAEGHSLLGMEGWYHAIRKWELYLEPGMIPPAVAVSCAEMIRTGTTCFGDQYFFMEQIVPVVEKSGMRAALAYGIVELGDQEASEHALAETERFLQQLQNHPRLTGWIGPHALFVDNRAETIRAELALADRYRTGLHIHLGTSGEEDRFCQQTYGRSAVQQMKKIGVLERPLMAAHCLTIPPDDFATLASAPFTAIMAPSACMRAGKQAAPLRAMQEAGIATALGTDNVANNNSYDLFKEMHILGKLMSYREGEPTAISSQRIVEMATIGGARALGLGDQTGSLEPGKRADLISLDLDEIGWSPRAAQDVYTALVYGVSGYHVRDVMVDGAWLMRDSRLTTLDYRLARAGLEEAFERLQEARKAGGD